MNVNVGRMVKNAYYRLQGYYPLAVDGLRFKCDPYNWVFWRSVANGEWERYTYRVLDKFLNEHSVYCDIGAWIGPTVLYAASKCKTVYCFEPDRVAYRYLLWNIHNNNLRNVMPTHAAISDTTGMAAMASFGVGLGDSMTSLLNEDKSKESVDVFCMSWKQWEETFQPGKIDFMKIDIEGKEVDLLPAIKDYLVQYKPTVYLSLHAPFFDRSVRKEKMERIVDAMSGYDRCLNEKLEDVRPEDLLSEENLSTFNAFVFTSEAD
jgi:FkbM family methyltransferase